ncbi:uncharacterized protein PRCAT00005876001 [Priceomyces carsonii]|uniref:uncharacterized protein n=1 Tax=Priceomyces carsonii TaxID=28549 RepID=UPI002EDA6482|nr:unnamed protein product [Priceomyces carsonii]
MDLTSRYTAKTKSGIIFSSWCTAITNPTSSGMEMSIMGTVVGLKTFNDYFEITPSTNGLINASIFIGAFLSMPFVRILLDRCGRRTSILIANLIMILGVLIQCTSGIHYGGPRALAQFVVGRIVSGAGNCLVVSSSPPLVAEIVPSNHRGVIMGAFHSCYYVGALIAAGVTYGTRNINSNWCWRAPLIVQFGPSIISALALLFTPESPRWLVSKGREEEALDIFTRIADGEAEVASKQIKAVKNAIVVERTVYETESVWKEAFSSKANLRRILINFIVAACVEGSGSSIATYYITTLLEQAGITLVSTQLKVAIIRNGFCLFACIIGCITFDIIGRKPQALIAMTGEIISLFILGALVKVYGKSSNTSGQYGAIAMMFIFSGFYSYCFTPLLMLYTPEIYPQRTRAVGITVLEIFDNGLGVFLNFMLPIGMANMRGNFYLLNGAWNLVFIPLIFFVFVETKGLDLEEIASLFGDGENAITFQKDDTSESDAEQIEILDTGKV